MATVSLPDATTEVGRYYAAGRRWLIAVKSCGARDGAQSVVILRGLKRRCGMAHATPFMAWRSNKQPRQWWRRHGTTEEPLHSLDWLRCESCGV
jgi:hypothetical protein